MARVTATKSDQNELVQSVYLKIGDRPGREKVKSIVEQPAAIIELLLKSDMFDLHQATI